MNLLFAFVVYFVVWWITLFAILPFGVRSQAETGEIVPGSDTGAPARPQLVWKVVMTTLVSALIFAALVGIVRFNLLPLETFSFLPHLRE
jgi:predicted secreted protein